MMEQLTDPQGKWHDLAAKHADDFATGAAQHDEENSYPFENLQALRDSGYAAMPVPVDMGGGATELAVNMHFGLPYVMCDLIKAGDEHPRPLLKGITTEKLMVFAAVTDPQVNSMKGITGLGYSTVRATKTDGGFLLNGRKGFGANSSPRGDLFGSTAIYDYPDEG